MSAFKLVLITKFFVTLKCLLIDDLHFKYLVSDMFTLFNKIVCKISWKMFKVTQIIDKLVMAPMHFIHCIFHNVGLFV